MRSMLIAVTAASCACLVGCSTSDVRTVSRDAYDCVTPGMTREEVVAYLGTPTDESLNTMHWEIGDFRDAWVLFDASGEKVTSKYWQDDETLRLADVPSVR